LSAARKHFSRARKHSAFTKHTVSSDFAERVEPHADARKVRVLHGLATPRESRQGDDRCANAGKKAILSIVAAEKVLAPALWCVIFRAELFTWRSLAPAVTNIRGVRENGEKRWRTDEVRSPDADF
jgi:hypothetical protein